MFESAHPFVEHRKNRIHHCVGSTAAAPLHLVTVWGCEQLGYLGWTDPLPFLEGQSQMITLPAPQTCQTWNLENIRGLFLCTSALSSYVTGYKSNLWKLATGPSMIKSLRFSLKIKVNQGQHCKWTIINHHQLKNVIAKKIFKHVNQSCKQQTVGVNEKRCMHPTIMLRLGSRAIEMNKADG